MKALAPSLVIAAHGSRNRDWCNQIHEFAGHVADSPGIEFAFAEVRTAFLEASSPSIAEAVREMLDAGAPRVLVAPLFLTVSTHLGEDVPGVLGKPVPVHVAKRLRSEGHEVLPHGLPVELLDLGSMADVLSANVERRLSLRTRQSREEAVVLCAHGSGLHHDAWESLMRRVRTRVMSAGYGYANHAYVGHGVGMSPDPTMNAILKAGSMAGIRRVHVIPVLVGKGRLQREVISKACDQARQRRETIELIYAYDAILPDGDLAAHVAAVALRAIGAFATVDRGALA